MFAGIVDSSGLRFGYTEQLRQYDAGILEVGQWTNPYSLFIPPNATSFRVYAECNAECAGAVRFKIIIFLLISFNLYSYFFFFCLNFVGSLTLTQDGLNFNQMKSFRFYHHVFKQYLGQLLVIRQLCFCLH